MPSHGMGPDDRTNGFHVLTERDGIRGFRILKGWNGTLTSYTRISLLCGCCDLMGQDMTGRRSCPASSCEDPHHRVKGRKLFQLDFWRGAGDCVAERVCASLAS